MSSYPPPSAVDKSSKDGAQFLKFAVVGLAGTGIHYLVFLASVMLFGIAPGIAAFSGAVVGACIVYALNRRITFNTTRRHRETFPRFAALAIVGAVFNGIIVGLLSKLGIHFLLAQVIATIIVLFINFVVSKKWIYR